MRCLQRYPGSCRTWCTTFPVKSAQPQLRRTISAALGGWATCSSSSYVSLELPLHVPGEGYC